MINRRDVARWSACAGVALALWANGAGVAMAADEAPNAMIERLSKEVLDQIKADKSIQAGDVTKIMALVDSKIMPNVNFQRMTAYAVGRPWLQATADQRKKLQDEFKLLLVRTYSGAMAQVGDRQITVEPLRGSADSKEVTVDSIVRGGGSDLKLQYKLEKTPGNGAGWKIVDLNVESIWLVDSFNKQFTPEIKAGGIDGLIAALVQRNKSNEKKSG